MCAYIGIAPRAEHNKAATILKDGLEDKSVDIRMQHNDVAFCSTCENSTSDDQKTVGLRNLASTTPPYTSKLRIWFCNAQQVRPLSKDLIDEDQVKTKTTAVYHSHTSVQAIQFFRLPHR